MGELPSIELLEAVHHFPGPYTFKVIGKSDNGFDLNGDALGPTAAGSGRPTAPGN